MTGFVILGGREVRMNTWAAELEVTLEGAKHLWVSSTASRHDEAAVCS